MFIFPYQIGRRLQHVPWVTIALIAVNVVASVAFFFVMFRVVTDVVMAAKTADDLLAMLIDRLAWWMFYPDWRGLYTWFTSSFLHADPMHLVSNMFFLYLFGSVVEDAVGHWRYLALYVGGAAAAAALYALTELIVPGPAKMSIGASGALAAVMAIFALRFHKTKMRFAYFFMIFFRIRAGTFETTSIVGVGIWAVGELLYGLLQLGGVGSSTAHWAHLGGLVFGGVAAYTLGFIKQASNEYLLDDVAAYSAAGAHGAAASAYARIAENDAANPFWQLANARERLLAGGAGATGAAEQLAAAMDALVRQGRKVEVLEAYEQVGASVALPAPTLLAVASAAEGLKRYDLAQPAYARLLREHPGRPEAEKAEFRLAHVLLATGRDADARAVWRDFLARYPESMWREYAEPRLAAIGPAEGTAAPAVETPAPAPAAPPAAGPDGLPAVEHEPSAETGWTF